MDDKRKKKDKWPGKGIKEGRKLMPALIFMAFPAIRTRISRRHVLCAAACLLATAAIPRARADVEFLGPSFSHSSYDYAPSFMYGDGPEIRTWWCGQGAGGDNVFHASWGGAGWHDITVVLSPDGGTWDASHTCDPSVAAGSFSYSGASYRYAMYYTGTDHPESSGRENRVGVAFSNDGLRWVKHPAPVVAPEVFPSGSYGAGMPSAWSPGGSEVWLVYLDSTTSPPNSILLRTSADGLNFGPPVRTNLDGGRGFQGPDIAYDGDARRWIAAVKWDCDLNVILLQSCGDPVLGADSLLGNWIEIGFFNGTNTGRPMNHNPGLLRLPGGGAYREAGTGKFFVQFGWGDVRDGFRCDDPATWAPETWDLAWGSFTVLTDDDGDCQQPPGDCDDADMAVFPGAPEICDGKDNDCDGNIDEDFECIMGSGTRDCGICGTSECTDSCTLGDCVDPCAPEDMEERDIFPEPSEDSGPEIDAEACEELQFPQTDGSGDLTEKDDNVLEAGMAGFQGGCACALFFVEARYQ